MIYRSSLIFIGVVVGVVLANVLFWSFKYRDIVDKEGEKPGFLRRGIVGRQMARKERNMENLRIYIGQNNTITNNNVEKLLRVSHATASRYLEELEKEGVLEQVGGVGQSVHYRSLKHE